MEEIRIARNGMEEEEKDGKTTPKTNGSIYANGAFDDEDNNNKIKLQFRQNRIIGW